MKLHDIQQITYLMEKQSSKYTREEKRLAKKIRGIIKDPNHTRKQLKNAIPYKDEVVGALNCLAGMLKEEVEKDKRLSSDFRKYLLEETQILNDCLKDNQVSESERTRILDALDNFGKQYASVEIERERQSGKTKRFVAGTMGTLGLGAIIAALFKRD